jgi:fido (protein-threonine AMPylation protein)
MSIAYWMKSQIEPKLVIQSLVFDYEFEFIHPFADGNGRMSGSWDTFNIESLESNSLPIFLLKV